ncbi:hypothetical protein HOG98_01335 [bacterium]|jgi:hypothetical protein|nr:hypothetical protein [bacterium]
MKSKKLLSIPTSDILKNTSNSNLEKKRNLEDLLPEFSTNKKHKLTDNQFSKLSKLFFYNEHKNFHDHLIMVIFSFCSVSDLFSIIQSNKQLHTLGTDPSLAPNFNLNYGSIPKGINLQAWVSKNPILYCRKVGITKTSKALASKYDVSEKTLTANYGHIRHHGMLGNIFPFKHNGIATLTDGSLHSLFFTTQDNLSIKRADVSSITSTKNSYCMLLKNGTVVERGPRLLINSEEIKHKKAIAIHSTVDAYFITMKDLSIYIFGPSLAKQMPKLPENKKIKSIHDISHSYSVVLNDQRILCWSMDLLPSPVCPPTIPNGLSITSIKTTEYAFCLLLNNGAIRQWGLEGSKHLNVTLPENRIGKTLHSSRTSFCLVLDNGKPLIWGSSLFNEGALTIPEKRKIIDIQTTKHALCALLDNNQIRVSGSERSGGLQPVQLQEEKDSVISIHSTHAAFCAVLEVIEESDGLTSTSEKSEIVKKNQLLFWGSTGWNEDISEFRLSIPNNLFVISVHGNDDKFFFTLSDQSLVYVDFQSQQLCQLPLPEGKKLEILS